jgi:hypothetical protein
VPLAEMMSNGLPCSVRSQSSIRTMARSAARCRLRCDA